MEWREWGSEEASPPSLLLFPSAAPRTVDRPTPKAWPHLLNERVYGKLQTRETQEAPVAREGLQG